jgi:hypothetical protein
MKPSFSAHGHTARHTRRGVCLRGARTAPPPRRPAPLPGAHLSGWRPTPRRSSRCGPGPDPPRTDWCARGSRTPCCRCASAEGRTPSGNSPRDRRTRCSHTPHHPAPTATTPRPPPPPRGEARHPTIQQGATRTQRAAMRMAPGGWVRHAQRQCGSTAFRHDCRRVSADSHSAHTCARTLAQSDTHPPARARKRKRTLLRRKSPTTCPPQRGTAPRATGRSTSQSSTAAAPRLCHLAQWCPLLTPQPRAPPRGSGCGCGDGGSGLRPHPPPRWTRRPNRRPLPAAATRCAGARLMATPR